MGRTLKSGKYLKGRVKTDLRLQDIWDLSEKWIVGKEKVYAGTGMHQMYKGMDSVRQERSFTASTGV